MFPEAIYVRLVDHPPVVSIPTIGTLTVWDSEQVYAGFGNWVLALLGRRAVGRSRRRWACAPHPLDSRAEARASVGTGACLTCTGRHPDWLPALAYPEMPLE